MSRPGPWFQGTHTVRNEVRDFVEWHRGRAPYVFWGLLLDGPALDGQLARVASWLDGFLLDGYVREPHVTLDVCGFPADRSADDESFTPALIDAQVMRLAAAAPAPFSIRIGGLDSFTSAPFLKVFDVDRGIAGLRQCLAENGRHRLFGDYVPHVTVGLYRDAWPLPAVAERIAACPTGDELAMTVRQADLLGYAPSVIGGALTRLGSFDLASRQMHWTAAGEALLPAFTTMNHPKQT